MNLHMINPKWCMIWSLQSFKFMHVLNSGIHEYSPYMKQKWNEIWYEEFLANFISKSNHHEKLNSYKFIQPLLGLRHALRSGPLPSLNYSLKSSHHIILKKNTQISYKRRKSMWLKLMQAFRVFSNLWKIKKKWNNKKWKL